MRFARDRQSVFGSIRQRKPIISSTSSGSRPARMVPTVSFHAESMDTRR